MTIAPVLPVVLVHGIDDTARKFRVMQPYLQDHGWPTYAPSLTPKNGDRGLPPLAQQLATFIEEQVGPTQPINLIGFSMGGLVSRYYLQRLGGLDRVHRFISIASPHHGTWIAYGRWNEGAAQMRPDSDFLQDLNRDIAQLATCLMVSLWTRHDLMIVPATSSVVPIAQNIEIPVPLHPWMVRDRRCLETIVTLLRADR